ncbi:hypothetical protein NQZ68_022057 [Dissostichus eleginoides]|nr:hypothetical protein NQZ68_022057 [Dissostichus eleginoides]
MDEFKRIKMSLFLIMLLQSTAAVTGQENSLTVKVGDEVTFPCDIEGDNQDNCDWSFGESDYSEKNLVETGQIVGEAKSDRLNVTQNCALVIKNVTEEDAGFYTCTQIRSAEQSSNLLLFVATGEDTKPATTEPMTETATTEPMTTEPMTTEPMTTEPMTTEPMTTEPATTEPATTEPATTEHPQSGLLRLIVVSVGLATLIMIVVAVNIWTRIKEKKTQMEEISVRYDVDDGTVN